MSGFCFQKFAWKYIGTRIRLQWCQCRLSAINGSTVSDNALLTEVIFHIFQRELS